MNFRSKLSPKREEICEVKITGNYRSLAISLQKISETIVSKTTGE